MGDSQLAWALRLAVFLVVASIAVLVVKAVRVFWPRAFTRRERRLGER